jgi:hypothetical protein
MQNSFYKTFRNIFLHDTNFAEECISHMH